ncbi:MAG: DNA2/NAM7 family helicase [Verrucomicrobia bacterium]|nr:DNA2/NAM7 family helicase [Verrucomicrobiota bacterium]MCH8528812.1 DNA2/NAM7 family helicase [Kiritimatiellia bacterium]
MDQIDETNTREKAEDLLAELDRQVRREESVSRRERDAFLKRPLQDRVASGWTLSPVKVHPVPRSKLLRLEADLRFSRYREGDILRIHTGFMGDADGLDATVVHEESNALQIRPEKNPESVISSTAPLIADPAYVDFTPFYLAALQECAESYLGRTRVLPLLLGDLRLRVEGHLYDVALDLAEERGLNEAQADAFASCVACSNAYYVQGPPGTGKTRVLAEVVRALVDRGERVWVSALTHRAINHALSAVRKIAPEAKLARVADIKNEVPPGIKLYEYMDNSPLLDEPGGYAVGATPFVGMTQRLRDWECDTLLIDEASQVTLPLALMAMLKAKRVLLFGDDCQLPPIQVACPLSSCVERSVLQRIPLSDMHTLLNLTYRMHPELCIWPSTRFYDRQLIAHPSTRKSPPPFKSLPGRLFCVSTSSLQEEIRQVVQTASRLVFEEGHKTEDLAVLTPFRVHARSIRTGLREKGLNLRVDTVERMQGQECDVVLYAAGVDTPKRVTALAEHLFHPNKLNVAVTRARGGVILFAHRVLMDTPLYGEMGRHQSIWRDLFEEAEEMSV